MAARLGHLDLLQRGAIVLIPARLWLGLGLVVAAALSSARTEPRSFLVYPAPNHETLMRQIRTEDKVAQRFMRHFGMTKQEVLAYMDGLRLSRLEQDGMYLIYNVPDSEELRSKVMFYRKGTLVWVNQMGQPVLKASCGNPMVRGTDVALAYIKPSPMNMTSTMAMRDFEAVSPPETQFIMNPVASMPPIVIEDSAQALIPQAPEIPTVSSQGFGAPWWILPVIGGFFIVPDDEPPPIPEPATIITLSVGAAYFARRRAAARRA